jgi:hypothetical protein
MCFAAGTVPGNTAPDRDCDELAKRVAELERTVLALQEKLAQRAHVPGAAAADAARTAWQTPSSWQRLRRGMSRYEVMATLGEPGKVVIYDGFERWEYPDFRGGRLNFDDRGALVGWRRPPRSAPTGTPP